MAIEKEILDQLLAGRDPQEVFGKNGLVDELKQALSERITERSRRTITADRRKAIIYR